MEDKTSAEQSGDDSPDFDIKSESLIPLLEGKVKAHFHCHRADDIFTAIRIAKEFGLKYTLVHCTDGHLIADELKEENATAIIGPIICDPCKPELANITPRNAGILNRAGIKTAICTDHSEIPIQYLPISVGIAVKVVLTGILLLKQLLSMLRKVQELRTGLVLLKRARTQISFCSRIILLR